MHLRSIFPFGSDPFPRARGRGWACGWLLLLLSLTFPAAVTAGTWTPLATPAPGSVSQLLLLTDGTVMAQNGGTAVWYKLTPDIHGSYVNGTWSTLAAMHDTRLYYASDVLQNGNVFVAGGEYGTGDSNGEVYNPLTNTWTAAPASGQSFSDSISETLPNGDVLIAPVSPSTSGGTIIFDYPTNTWIAGPKLFRGSDADEQAWVKLADGSFLTIDSATTSERYIPSLNQWVNDGAVPVDLWAIGEIGANTLLPSGKAIQLGASGSTAIYTPGGSSNPGTWVAGPVIPQGMGTVDAPLANMVTGHVLCATGPAGTYDGPTTFFEYDPAANSFTQVNGPTGTTYNPQPYVCAMLDLPDGTVLLTGSGTQLYCYTPSGAPLAAGTPAISTISVNADGSYTLTGTLLNGICEGAAYGDDRQMATSYPIVRLTSGTNVYYAKTYGWSSTSVMTGSTPETTSFLLPRGLPAGTYSVVVAANGNASAAVPLTTPSAADAAPTVATAAAATPSAPTGTTTAFSVLGAGAAGESSLTYTWTTTAVPSGAANPSYSINGTNAAKNTTATFYHAGAYTFNVIITDTSGLSVASSVSVTVSQTLTSAVITPALANLTSGQTQQLTAKGLDQFALAMTAQPAFTWALTTGNGSVSGAGLYTTPSSGSQDIVTATTGAFSGTAAMDVVTAPWISTDIGSPGDEGSAFDSSGTFTVTGEGSDIGGTTDQFHFVYRGLSGNGVIIARVASQQNTNAWAKAGVMIRDGLAATTDNAMMAITPGHGAAFFSRTTAGGSATDTSTGGPIAPYWVKLVRSGGTFTGYRSANGATWTQEGTAASITMGSTVCIGLAVCSQDGKALSTSTFDNVSIFAAANDTLAVNAGAAGTVNVLANDSALTGTTLTVTSVTQGAEGAVVNNGDGTVTYTASANASAGDTFTYTVSDGVGDAATATVSVVINGLRAYYKFEEGAGATSADLSGNGRTSTLNGTTWTGGVEGTTGVAFAGASTSYGTIPAMNLNTDTATMTAWVKISGAQDNFSGIVLYSGQGNASGMVFNNTNQLAYNWNNLTSQWSFRSNLVIPYGTWTFVAVVITPTNATLYVQPQGGSMSSVTNSVANTASAFSGVTDLGLYPGYTTRSFSGSLDEVRIYNIALSGTAIAVLANASPTVATAAAATPSPVTGTGAALSVLGGSNIVSPSTLTCTWSAPGLPAGAAAPVFSPNATHAAQSSTATFTQAGNYTLMATIMDSSGGSTTSSVPVTVNQTLGSVTVTGGTPVINPQITQQFTATGKDQFGNALAVQPPFTWTNTGYGSVNSSGLFTAPYASGAASVTATSGGISNTGGASVTVSTPWNGWLTSAFTAAQAANPAISGPSADPDNDGLNNLLEYAFGTTPTAADPAPNRPIIGMSGGNLTLTYRRNLAATDLTWQVQQSADCIHWTAASVTETILNTTGNIQTVQDAVAAGSSGSLFLRLQITIP